jgi:opacity protein-like surface antigen
VIGVIAGYNFSVHQFVLGLEGDYNPSQHNTSICRGSTDTPSICNDAWLGYSKLSSEIKYKGSLRVRGGYQLHKYLAYITAGAAFVQTKNNLDVFCPDGCSTSDAAPFLSNTTTIKNETRPIYGIGAEYKLTNKLNVGMEYLILKTSRVSQSVNHAATYGSQLISSDITGKISISRLRLAYTF